MLVCILCIRNSSSFASSDTCPSNVLTYFTVPGTCFAALRSDRFRSIYPGVCYLRQENESPPTDLNGAGCTRQTPLSVSEDEMQPQETETTTLRQRLLRRFPPTETWIFYQSKPNRADNCTDFVGRCVLRTRFERVFESLRVA